MTICVRDVMVRDVITLDAQQNAKNAARIMTKFGISGVIVQSDKNIVGIVTERDILTRVVASGQNPEDIIIKDIMTEPVIVVNPLMPLEKAVSIMFQEKIKKLPVVEKEEDRVQLVGILSLTDIARLHPQLLEGIRTLSQMNVLETEADFYIR
jgi:CBS domain-containing protein